MKRIITPAIFLSAQMLVGCTSSQEQTEPGTDELAGELDRGIRCMAKTTEAGGVIVLGERTTRGSGRMAEKLRSADQVFLPMTN